MHYITLLVFVIEGKEHIFNEYESKVLPLLAKYNGKLLYRIRPDKQQFVTPPEQYPYEIHIVSFGSKEDFNRYKQDEERQSYVRMLQDAVERIVLIESIAAAW